MGILTNWLRNSRTPRRDSNVRRLKAEKLEERTAPAIFTVTWDGTGVQPVGTMSLQQAITAANLNPGADQINYNAGIASSLVTTKAGGPGLLPDITDQLTIDGIVGGTKITVFLDSSSAADPVSGFVITGAAGNSIIRNLSITDPGGNLQFNPVPTEFGVKIDAATGGFNLQNVSITNIDGDAVVILNSPNNIIGGAGASQNVTIGTATTPNNGAGVHISGGLATNNLVQQSRIEGNAGDGILIDTGSSNNVVGGFTSSPVNSGNIIIQNNGNGVHLNDSDGNRIQRNFIGNDGADAKANAANGILIENGSANSIIGGNDLSAGNKISGNTENGIYIRGITSSGNQIQSNLIGLDPDSLATAMPNSGNGILVENAANTLVGSTTTAANFIAGNNLHGVSIIGVDSAGSVVVNNRIGISGTSLPAPLDKKLGNVQDGVFISNSKNITVGGGGTNAQNIIGANRNGIAVFNSQNITIKGNQLGINKLADNTYPNLGNLNDGILIQNSSTIQIGGTQSLEGNKAASNRNGVHVIGSSGVTLQGNFIGPNLTGTIIIPQGGLIEPNEPAFQAEDGVLIENSTNVAVGTPAQGGGNLISHNRHGISITKGSSNVTIQNNRIGTQVANAPTQHDLGNQDDGVFIDNSKNVLIGGTGPSNANIIAKNLDGIQISGGSSFVTVQANQIRNNSQSGVRIENSSNVTVGGAVVQAKNIINNRRLAGIDKTFTVDGVFLVSGSHDNVVSGNYLGTDSTNITTAGLTGNGVLVDGSFKNKIGGLDAVNEGNVIAFNSFNGIAVVESSGGAGSANGNQLLGNSIFNNGRLGIDLGNTSGDVTLNDLGDGDAGANNSQNFPVLVLAQSTAGTGTRIQGIINTTNPGGRTYRIEFFHIDVPNPTGNPTNYGQGRTFLGSLDVTTDGNGDASFTFINASIVLPAGQFVTATATDLTTGDTSEFSLAQVIEGAPGPITYVVNNDGNIFPSEGADLLIPSNGSMTLALAIRLANEHPGADRIVFQEFPQYTISNSTITYFQESRNLFTNGDLPDITDTLIIDGSPNAWPQVTGGTKRLNQNYGIVMNKATHGLIISDNPTAQAKFSNPNAQAGLVVLRHLSITGFGTNGVGVDITTKFGGANLQDFNITGFGGDGVRIINAPNNIIGGSGAQQAVTINAVSGTGVNIIGAASTNNLIQQTSIGNTAGAGGNGIWIQGADNNTIGGFVTGTGVSIRGSGANGIFVVGSSGTRIQRSTVGDPTNAFANHFDGIRIEDSAKTLIGGVNASAGNTIAGNTENGIHVLGALSAGLQIQSNTIGTTTAPNSGNGIFVDNVAGVLIGSTVTAANNVDGNNLNGILIQGSFSAGARIVNTSVGKNGGNVIDGIVVDGVSDVVIGGAAANAGGTIAGNRRGLSLINSSKVTLQQYVVSGNSEEGIRMEASTGVLIGGTSSSLAGNKIVSNRDGVLALNSSFITFQGNSVLNQSQDGVIIDGTGSVIIGSPFQFGGNVIGGNRNGVRVINNSANFTIQNNVIGTGTGSAGNTDDGILLEGISGATIGGTQPLSGNFVSGNRNGLHLSKSSSTATVLGNVFANSTESGIKLEGSSSNTIGGQTVAERNVISSNALNGVFLTPDFSNVLFPIFSNDNRIQGNFIGVNQAGTGNFGNGNAGIYIDGGNNNLIGGKVHDVAKKLEQGNIIANSGASGVAVVTDNGPATGNSILGNGIFNSGLLGIDLGGNLGLVDFNDDQDLDTGANNLQNFPELTFAQVGLVSSVAQGKLNSTPGQTFRIEFFGDAAANPNGTPAGFGQGKTFLGSLDVTTDASGDATFNFFAPVSFGVGGIISATATNLNTGDTSEFSKAQLVEQAVGKIVGQKFEDLNGNGVFDAGEPGLPGWVIDLEVADANGVFDGKVDAKATTDATGHYSFATLTDGTYKLSEELQPGWVQTAAPTPNPMQITGGATIANVDFGNFKMAKVFGVKFEDKNGNQVRDPGEGPLAGVTINLMDAKTATIFASTVTDLSGNYAFTNLFVGKFGKNDTGFYRVREVVPTGYKQTTINPPDFQIVSGTNVGPLDFGNQLLGGGGGGGGPGAGTIIVAGSGEGVTGTVRVFNASKLTQMFSFVPYGTTFRGGVRVAKGDVNGDGQADIITAPGAGTTLATAGISPLIKIFDGATGKLVRQFLAYDAGFKGGVYVGSGDVNGDGVSDIITGAGKTAPHVKVFDGKTGAELFSFMAIGNNFSGGVRVAMGDVNGDGFADLITAPGKGMAPVVRVWDGSNFGVGPPTLMREFTAFESSFTGGLFVATGNVNGDAFADIIVGPDAGRRADVKVYDGATNKLLTTFTAAGDPTRPSMIFSDPAWNAGVRVTNADLNGDGLDDIVCGPGILRNPHIRGYSGKTGQKLIDFAPFPSTFLGGVFVG